MKVARTYCCAALLLVAIGCKTAPLASSAPAQPAVVTVSRRTPSSENSAALATVAVTRPRSVAAVDFQEPLPVPPAEQVGNSSQEVVGDVLTREWLQAEVEARKPSRKRAIRQ